MELVKGKLSPAGELFGTLDQNPSGDRPDRQRLQRGFIAWPLAAALLTLVSLQLLNGGWVRSIQVHVRLSAPAIVKVGSVNFSVSRIGRCQINVGKCKKKIAATIGTNVSEPIIPRYRHVYSSCFLAQFLDVQISVAVLEKTRCLWLQIVNAAKKIGTWQHAITSTRDHFIFQNILPSASPIDTQGSCNFLSGGFSSVRETCANCRTLSPTSEIARQLNFKYRAFGRSQTSQSNMIGRPCCAGLITSKDGVQGNDDHTNGFYWLRPRLILGALIDFLGITVAMTVAFICAACGLSVVKYEVPRQPDADAAWVTFWIGAAILAIGQGFVVLAIYLVSLWF